MYLIPLVPFRTWKTFRIAADDEAGRLAAAAALLPVARTRHAWTGAAQVAAALLSGAASETRVHLLTEEGRPLAFVVERTVMLQVAGRPQRTVVLDPVARPNAAAQWDLASQVAGIGIRRRMAGDTAVAIRTLWEAAQPWAAHLYPGRRAETEAALARALQDHPVGQQLEAVVPAPVGARQACTEEAETVMIAAVAPHAPASAPRFGIQVQALSLPSALGALFRAEFAPRFDPLPQPGQQAASAWTPDVQAALSRGVFLPMVY